MRNLQNRIRAWVTTRLGTASMHPHERAMRLLEESLELAQSLNVSQQEAERLVAHVFARPIGDAKQELGGVGACLLACTEACGYDLSQRIDDELARIESLPAARFVKRQELNATLGIGCTLENTEP